MRTFLLVLFTCFSFVGFGQDIIVKKNGWTINSKVIEITQTEIKYKRFDNLDGPIITIPKDDILVISYENGTREVINPTSRPVTTSVKSTDNSTTVNSNDDEIFERNKQLLQYYKKVFVTSDEPHLRDYSTDYIRDMHRWEIVKNRSAAELVIDIKGSEVFKNEFVGHAEFLNPKTNEVFYKTSISRDDAIMSSRGYNKVVKSIIGELQDFLNKYDGVK